MENTSEVGLECAGQGLCKHEAFQVELMTAVDELAEHYQLTGIEVQKALIAALHEVTCVIEADEEEEEIPTNGVGH